MSSTNAVEGALSISKEWKDREDAERRDFEAESRRRYCELIIRADSPQPDDARELADLMVGLEINAETARKDAAAVVRARELWTLHNDRDRRNTVACDARTKVREMKKRHQEELKNAFHDQGVAEHAYREASEAAWDLTTLGRERPYLFDQSEPPRLVFMPETAANADGKAAQLPADHFVAKPARRPAKFEELIHACPGASRAFLLSQVGQEATVEEAKKAFAEMQAPPDAFPSAGERARKSPEVKTPDEKQR